MYSLLQRWRCSCKFQLRRIGSRLGEILLRYEKKRVSRFYLHKLELGTRTAYVLVFFCEIRHHKTIYLF
jgi:hypothetical protein